MPSNSTSKAGAALARCKQTVGQGPASYRRPKGRLPKCASAGGKLNASKPGDGGTDRLLRDYGGHSVPTINAYMDTIEDGLSRKGTSKLSKLTLIKGKKKLRGLGKKSMF